MSRSYKAPYWTEGSGGSRRKHSKRAANRRVRKTKHDEVPTKNTKRYNRVYNSWDIVDWKFEDKKNPKSRRK